MSIQSASPKMLEALGLGFLKDYSLFLCIEKQNIDDINKNLKNYLIKGKFLDWPVQWKNPLVILGEEIL